MPDESPRPSSRPFGDFELLEKLGQGGMSAVYKARDLRTQELVALKIASRLVINDRQLSRRFELEYDLAHPLDHRNLVKVLDNGKHDKVPYLVMELVDGPSLSQHLKAHKRLSENDALAILLPVAEALTYLHKKQIVHRDIKPANILLTLAGEPKLADLGLIKNLDSMSRLTRSHLGLGTMQFASPEQFADARSVDARSDVYSLAATLYLMLTGEYPFGGGTMMSVVTRKLKNKFDPPLSKVSQLRDCVNTAIRLGLQADRDKRPASISEFAAILVGDMQQRAAELAANVTASPTKTKPLKKGEQERRGGARYAIDIEAVCRVAINAAGQRWQAKITDLSLTGLCLLAKRRFEIGSVLEITFTLSRDDSTVNQLARVRWAKSTESKAWLLGCEFVNAIAEDDLEAICEDGLDRTKMV